MEGGGGCRFFFLGSAFGAVMGCPATASVQIGGTARGMGVAWIFVSILAVGCNMFKTAPKISEFCLTRRFRLETKTHKTKTLTNHKHLLPGISA